MEQESKIMKSNIFHIIHFYHTSFIISKLKILVFNFNFYFYFKFLLFNFINYFSSNNIKLRNVCSKS